VTEKIEQASTAGPTSSRAFLSGGLKDSLPGIKGQMIFWGIGILGMAADLWSKAAVFKWLTSRDHWYYTVIDGFFYLVIAENQGAAFGIAQGQRTFLVSVSILALVAVVLLFYFGKIKHTIMHVALGMFFAGICGNLYDRLFNDGSVRDFIDIVYWPGKHWPAFNVADSLLCVGVGIMLVSSIVIDMPDRKHDRQQK
jgi:signal peptidase II